MNVFGNRLKALRKSEGLSQEELALELNKKHNLKIDRTMISKWETGFQMPVMNTVAILAKFFNVSIDYLNGDENKKYHYINLPSPNITKEYTTFPVIGEIAAGFEHIAIEDWEGDTVDVPDSCLKGHNKSDFFVLRVKGDSMYPEYREDDKVLILKQPTVNFYGQVAAVIYNDDCGTLKKVEYKKGEDWIRLVPINPSIPPILLKDEQLEHFRILGIPRMLIREYD